ncbi:MAG: hypothetical protein KDA65_17145 [Planctomycetaceae bacterium]|nr:hypothetical protein [Planctomycetaceae bacterium]
MSLLNLKRRRSAATRLADHAEPCEVRVLLSGNAIYPQQAAVNNAEAVQPEGKVNPFVLSPSDYNGTWEGSDGITYEFFVSGNNPENMKVKGSANAVGINGLLKKFKGKITNSVQLDGKFKGHRLSSTGPDKLKAQLSVHLTDSTHFEGTLYLQVKGFDPVTFAYTGEKI